MTGLEIEETIRRIMNTHGRVSHYGNRYSIELHSDDIRFDQLARLSEALGTRDINLDYMEGDSGYSEYTPGYPGRLTLEVTVNPS